MSPPKNAKNKKITTPLKTVKSDIDNGNGNEMDTVGMSLEKKINSSNKNMMFLSPLKSSVKNSGLRFVPISEEFSGRKEMAENDKENKEKKNILNIHEEGGDGQRDNTSPMRKSKRRR